MAEFAGSPTDEVPAIRAIGGAAIDAVFMSMSQRDPDGRDVDYLRWHCFDHCPEQYRVPGLRGSLRLVSTPDARAARLASTPRYDAVDHVMTYFFADDRSFGPFSALGGALRDVGRFSHVLPQVERDTFRFEGMAAAPRVKIGADVLPWWPATGVFLLIEEGSARPEALVAHPGVGGVWWAAGVPVAHPATAETAGLQLTLGFLDDDPVAVSAALRPVLEARWEAEGVRPLLAAPFHVVDPSALDRHLPQ